MPSKRKLKDTEERQLDENEKKMVQDLIAKKIDTRTIKKCFPGLSTSAVKKVRKELKENEKQTKKETQEKPRYTPFDFIK